MSMGGIRGNILSFLGDRKLTVPYMPVELRDTDAYRLYMLLDPIKTWVVQDTDAGIEITGFPPSFTNIDAQILSEKIWDKLGYRARIHNRNNITFYVAKGDREKFLHDFEEISNIMNGM